MRHVLRRDSTALSLFGSHVSALKASEVYVRKQMMRLELDGHVTEKGAILVLQNRATPLLVSKPQIPDQAPRGLAVGWLPWCR